VVSLSSILRALKKLEKERPQEAELQTWQEKYSLPEPGARDRKPLYILLGILLLCGVLFLANQLAVWQMRSIAQKELAAPQQDQISRVPESIKSVPDEQLRVVNGAPAIDADEPINAPDRVETDDNIVLFSAANGLRFWL